MVGAGHSMRLRVGLESEESIVFSYPELLKRHEKTIRPTSKVNPALHNKQDNFYLSMLKRAAKYDINPGDEDVDSGDEDSIPNRDGKADEYHYDDSFIDDSDMMLEDLYEYSPPDYDGFFIYHGALDGPFTSPPEKKKTTMKKNKPIPFGITKTIPPQSKLASVSQLKAIPPPQSTTTTIKSNQTPAFVVNLIEISDTEETDTDEEVEKLSISLPGNPSQLNNSSPNTHYDTNLTDKPTYFLWQTTPMDKISTINVEDTIKSTFPISLSSNSGSKPIKARPISVLPSINASTIQQSSPSLGISDKASTSNTSLCNLLPLLPPLEALMNKLRQDRQSLSFETKSKFPSRLRSTMLKIGNEMFDTYYQVDDNVVDHLISILPYNKFTMRKYLITRSGPAAVDKFQEEINQLIEVLAKEVKKLMPEHIQQYEEKQRQRELHLSNDDLPIERKFRCNTVVRRTIYDILTLDMYSVSLSNEIAELTNRPGDVTAEKKARRAMYSKILPCWPEPWMTTYDISRHYSGYKMKMKNHPFIPFSNKVSQQLSPSVTNINQLASTAVKRLASTPNALSSSENVPQLVQMGLGDDKRQRLSDDAYGLPINISSDDETEQRASHGNHHNSGHLFSTALPGNFDGLDYNSLPPPQKSSFMNISSLISKP